MKIGIVLETKEDEKAWNAFRFGVKALGDDHTVRTFLLGEAVECEGVTGEPYDVAEQMKNFLEGGGQILACGTCLRSRNMEGSETCPVSTMQDLLDLVVWADRVVNF